MTITSPKDERFARAVLGYRADREAAPYGQHLPIFHTPIEPLTEAEAERAAERYMDRADRAFLAGLATQEQYDAWTRALEAWVKRNAQRRL